MRHFLVCLATAMMLHATNVGAQTTTDSLPIWTSWVQSGSSVQKSRAIARLSEVPVALLPQSTQSVMIAEAERLNTARMSLPSGSVEDPGGDYYMSVVLAVARLETPAAYRAIIPGVGISRSIAERVALLGDEAVPELKALLARHSDPDATLATLGLVWFWADSTGAPLSAASRASILDALIDAYPDTSFQSQLGLSSALSTAGDAAMLSLAVSAEAKLRAAGGPLTYVANEMSEVVSDLERRETKLSSGMIVRRLERNVRAVCANRRAPQQGTCSSLAQIVSEVARQIDNGRTAPARQGLDSMVGIAQRAHADGVLTDASYALVGGTAERLLRHLE